MFNRVFSFLFSIKYESLQRQIFFAALFFIFTVLALGIDSIFFANRYFDGRVITNFLAVLYFVFFYLSAGIYLRKLMLVMVPLSYIGELIFCKLIGFYEYRTAVIPLYVPFGHAIVYASGYVLAQTHWAIQRTIELKKIFLLSFVLLFACVAIVFEDYFTLLFGSMFFLLLKRKKWENLYCFIAICVIFIELVGTFFGCWKWASKAFAFIQTSNPPMGAVFFYAGGDILLAKMVSYWKN